MEKRGSLKVILIILIIIIMLIIASYFIYINMQSKKTVKEVKITALKTLKCLTTCPEKGSGEIGYFLEKCSSACDEKYNNPPKLEDSPDEELKMIANDFTSCQKMIQEGFDQMISCLNDLLEKNSHIIDLSDVDVSVDY